MPWPRRFTTLIALALVCVAASCGHAQAQAVAQRTAPHSKAWLEKYLAFDRQAAANLTDSFVSNGTAGYFFEPGGAISNGIDLYDTTWWLALDPAAAARLDVSAVKAWANGVLKGLAVDSDDASTAEMHLIEATTLLRSLGVRRPNLQAWRLAAAIAGRRTSWVALIKARSDDATFESDAAGAESALAAAGRPVPPSLAAYFDGKAARVLSARRKPGGGAANDAATVLASVSHSFVSAHRAELRSYLPLLGAWIRSLPAIFQVAYASQLIQISSTVGLDWKSGRFCARGLAADLKQFGDPQMDYDARLAGCHIHISPPAYTPIGWPDTPVLGDPLLNTVDGIKVALATGRVAAFRRPVIKELETVWLPELRRQGVHAQLLEGVAALILGHLLHVSVKLPKPIASTIELARNRWSVYPMIVAYMRLQGDSPPLFDLTALTQLARQAPGLAALVVKTEGYAHPAATLESQAVKLIAKARGPAGLSYLMPDHGSPLLGTLTAAWVRSRLLPVSTLRSNRLLSAGDVFRDYSGRTPLVQPWLQIEAMLAAINAHIYPSSLSVWL